jgi:hypothetical protein
MFSVVASLVLGLVLLAAAGLKAVDGPGSRLALATYGVHGRAAWVVWGGLIVVEVGLGVGVALGLDWAATAAALLMAWACVVQVGAIVAGRTGAPCACFGSRGRVGKGSAGRAALLAAAFALLPIFPREDVTTQGWLAIGLGVALAGLVALAVVVLALAREVGMLRLAVSPRGALEVEHEGPEIGSRLPLLQGEIGPGREPPTCVSAVIRAPARGAPPASSRRSPGSGRARRRSRTRRARCGSRGSSAPS